MSNEWHIGFTKKDDSLQSASTRDPLGFEIIWTTFGSRVVPRLSTVSRGVPTFCAVVAHAWILDAFEERAEFSALSHREDARHRLTMVLETLHAFAVAHVTNKGREELRANLPGIERARDKLKGEEPANIGLERASELLVNQAGMGMSGRYRRPLMDSSHGLLDEDGRVSAGMRDAVEHALKPMDGVRDVLLGVLVALVTAKGHVLTFDVQQDGDISEEVVEASASLRDLMGPVKALIPLLKRALLIEPEKCAQQALYALLDTQNHHSARSVYKQLAQNLNDSGEVEELGHVQDVLELEEILWRVELLFDRLWEGDLSEDLTKTTYLGKDEDMLDELFERRGVIRRLIARAGDRSATLIKRLEALDTLLQKADRTRHGAQWLDFLTSLAHDYHGKVIIETRPGSSPWVIVQAHHAQILNGGYSPRTQRNGGWARDYYIHTLTLFKLDADAAQPEAHHAQ